MERILQPSLFAASLTSADQSRAADEEAITKAEFPSMMKTRFLGNMRDQLQAKSAIQAAPAIGSSTGPETWQKAGSA